MYWHRYPEEDPTGEEATLVLEVVLWRLVATNVEDSLLLDDLDSLGQREHNIADALVHLKLVNRVPEMCQATAFVTHIELSDNVATSGVDNIALKEVARTLSFAQDETVVLLCDEDPPHLQRWRDLGFEPVLTDEEMWIVSSFDLLELKNTNISERCVANAWWRK